MAEFHYSCKKLKVLMQNLGYWRKPPLTDLSDKSQKVGDDYDSVGKKQDWTVF